MVRISNRPRSQACHTGVTHTWSIRTSGCLTTPRNGGDCSNSSPLIETPFQGDQEAPPTRASRPVWWEIFAAILRQLDALDNTKFPSSQATTGNPNNAGMALRQRLKPRRLPPLGAAGSMTYFLGAAFGTVFAAGLTAGFTAGAGSFAWPDFPSEKRMTKLLSSRRFPSDDSSCAR